MFRKLKGIFNRKKSEPGIFVSFENAVVTDCGLVRRKNEDAYLVCTSGVNGSALFAVSDGMGGKNNGEAASRLSLDILKERFVTKAPAQSETSHFTFPRGKKPEEPWVNWLRASFAEISQCLVKEAAVQKAENGLGATLAAVVADGNKAWVANAGDSRVYLFRNSRLRLITQDHSLPGILQEKGLLDDEEIYDHPRRNELMNYLGQKEELRVDTFSLDLFDGDTIILCTDGLWSMVRDLELKEHLRKGLPPAETCRELVLSAKKAGGEDNITIIIVKVRQNYLEDLG